MVVGSGQMRGRAVTEGGGTLSAEQKHLQTAGRNFLFLEVQQRQQRKCLHNSSARCDAAERDRSISGWLRS